MRSVSATSDLMARLLVVHHTPSPSMRALLEAVTEGASAPEIEDVDVVTRAALSATATDVLAAQGYIVGTPANLGYMSGALKHFFDTVYYPCLGETTGRPVGMYLHGNSDTDGAKLGITRIITGLGWKESHRPVQVIGEPARADLDACWDLGATLAALLTAPA
jgi:multimeric flavodoxin WrbA